MRIVWGVGFIGFLVIVSLAFYVVVAGVVLGVLYVIIRVVYEEIEAWWRRRRRPTT